MANKDFSKMRNVSAIDFKSSNDNIKPINEEKELVSTTIWMEKEMRTKLKLIAISQEKKVTHLIREILTEYVEKN